MSKDRTLWRPKAPRIHESICDCNDCEMVLQIAAYMLYWMPPSDRALWRMPAPRLELPS